jgi:hypothetical protein
MDTNTIIAVSAKSIYQVAVSRRTGHVCENHREIGIFIPAGAACVVPTVYELAADTEQAF